jgi:hypothetical protein
VLGFLLERFGIPPAVFDDYSLLRRGTSVWLLRRDERISTLASLRVESVGLLLLRRVGAYLKPTSAALQIFGAQVRKNMVRLRPSQLRELVEKGEIRGEFPATPGFVVVVAAGLTIGCALYLPDRLLSRLPRHLSAPRTWEHLPPEGGAG